MTARTRLTAGLAAATFLLIAAASASAYNGQVAATATVSAESAACGDAFTVASTFLDLEGLPVGGLSVKWSFLTSQSPDDAINDTNTVTDADGVATTTVTLAAIPGDRTIGVTSDDVTASMVVSPSCPGTALPRTSTVAPEAPSTSVIALVASAIVVVLAASIFATVRRRAHRD